MRSVKKFLQLICKNGMYWYIVLNITTLFIDSYLLGNSPRNAENCCHVVLLSYSKLLSCCAAGHVVNCCHAACKF